MLEFIDRKGSNSKKYDALQEHFGRENLLPLWVADMDCRAPTVVQDTIRQCLAHGVYGYSSKAQEENSRLAILNWLESTHGVKGLKSRDCLIFAGVLEALAVCIESLCAPDEAVILNSPAYNHFYPTIEASGRRMLENYLTVDEGGRFTIDFELLERQIQQSPARPRIFLLCSPHNPMGKVWSQQELNEVISICQKYDLYLISDEIHFDLIYPEHRHQCILRSEFCLSYDKIIMISAPSKTFNIPALRSAYLLSRNQALLEKLGKFCRQFEIGNISLMGHLALQACYTRPEAREWLGQLLRHLDQNRNILHDFIQKEFPELRHSMPEGTYLYWVDCRDFLHGDPAALRKFFMDAGLALGWGDLYHGNSCVRINFACEQGLLLQALEQWKQAYAQSDPNIAKT